MDAENGIRISLWVCGIYFANLNGNISEEEAAYIEDIQTALGGEDFEELDNSYFQNQMTKLISKQPHIFKLEIPLEVIYLQIYDNAYGTGLATQVKSMFFRYANAVTKADGTVSYEEEQSLQEYKKLLFGYGLNNEVNDESETKENMNPTVISAINQETNQINLDTPLIQLNSLIGLDKVKNDVGQLVNFLKVQQMRKDKGMDLQSVSRHLVFYGNPGTGKTTVARLLSQIYKSLGILSKGHLIETDRAGLVAGYVGQTALKVREVVNSAIGGVLFIDEAYTLSSGDLSDFGREAIEILLKMMEDNREDLIVVVAGYTDKMSTFLQTNPRLRSRFNKYLEFQDYTSEELVAIFKSFCTNGDYNLTLSTENILYELFTLLSSTKDETFGNGRLARNLYEMTINNQANRIISLPHVDENILSSIDEIDIPKE